MTALFKLAVGWLTSSIWWIVGVGALSLMSWGSVQTYRLKLSKAETQEVQKLRVLDHAQATAAALKQTTEYRAEEQRRLSAQKEAADEADRQLTQARADAAIADAAAGRLQHRVAALVAAAREAARHPAPVAASPPAEDPIGMLAELQRRADERAGVLARIADERGAAGAACERQYDALTPP